MKRLFLFSTALLFNLALCQSPKSLGQEIIYISTAVGDLNKDKIADKVIVWQDTLAEKKPYGVSVYFGNNKKEFDFFVTSYQAIEPEFPEGRENPTFGDGFSEARIEKNLLVLETQLTRGHFEYKYRFQNGKFELVGYEFGNSDGRGTISTKSFNLSTGKCVFTDINYETDKIISKKTRKIKPNPLPDLVTIDRDALDNLISDAYNRK